jgi:hypothetical protein
VTPEEIDRAEALLKGAIDEIAKDTFWLDETKEMRKALEQLCAAAHRDYNERN